MRRSHPDDVRLPSLRDTLGEVVRVLAEDPGFILLAGSRIDLLSDAETELAYVALGLQLGIPVSQDADGTLLGLVRDERVERTGPDVRLYRTRERQDFHTDIIGLLCLHGPRRAG